MNQKNTHLSKGLHLALSLTALILQPERFSAAQRKLEVIQYFAAFLNICHCAAEISQT